MKDITTHKVIVRVTVKIGTSKPVIRGIEVEFIGSLDSRELAEQVLGSCVKDSGIIKTIQDQEIVNVIEIPN